MLGKPEAYEGFPFGPDVSVMKVANKMFATLVGETGISSMNLKCNPDEAIMLRDIFPAISPGYHMNKRHWNTIVLDASVPVGELERMIDHSYTLVVKGLPRAGRMALEIRHGKELLYL
jgi:predicted DNA-binding protein (MmcQ/YjbR family)